MIAQSASQLSDLSWVDAQLRVRLEKSPREVLREYGLDLPPDIADPVLLEVTRLVFLVWHDGQVVPRHQFQIDPSDEGLLFGRGVWESTRTVAGLPWLWETHLARLIRTAELLDIAIDPARLPDKYQVRDFVRSLTSMEVLVRLNVSAGRAGHPGTVWMTASLPPTPVGALRLKTVRYPFEKGHPYLTWKTFQYASRLQLGRQAARTGFDSVLLVDDEDFLLEAAHANIFVRFDDAWVTPVADGGLLPGTTRQHLLNFAPSSVRERKISCDDLSRVREVFVTSSNVGIVPVTQIDQHSFPIGPETMNLVRWLADDQSSHPQVAIVSGLN